MDYIVNYKLSINTLKNYLKNWYHSRKLLHMLGTEKFDLGLHLIHIINYLINLCPLITISKTTTAMKLWKYTVQYSLFRTRKFWIRLNVVRIYKMRLYSYQTLYWGDIVTILMILMWRPRGQHLLQNNGRRHSTPCIHEYKLNINE